jgi:hypothetical protein
MKSRQTLATVAALTLLLAPALAQEKKPDSAKADPAAKTADPPVNEKVLKTMLKNSMRAFENADLSAETNKKAEELFGKSLKEVIIKREKAGISQDLVKKYTSALKQAREAGKKGRNLPADMRKSTGFSDDQSRVFEETEATLDKARMEVVKLLTAEQFKKLPEQLQKRSEKQGAAPKK